MVCATAEELQARLAFRALWPSGAEGDATAAGSDIEAGHASALYKSLRAEVDEALKETLARRLARLERRVELLCSDAGSNGAQGGSQAAPAVPTKKGKGKKGEKKSLSKALSKALQAAESATQKPEKTFAPSIHQVAPQLYWIGEIAEVRILEGDHAGKWLKCKVTSVGSDPGFYDINVLPTDGFGKIWSDMDVENISRSDLRKVDPVDVNQNREEEIRESITSRATLENLTQNLASRERQIGELEQQLNTVQKICAERKDEAKAADVSLQRLLEDPSLLKEAQTERVSRRKARVEELSANLKRYNGQVKLYTAIAQQQRAFFLQSERVAVSGGQEAINRHPAGDVALTPQPPSLSDEQPEVWDVGSAVANPYVVDSWPFEPNVLARRAPQEASMEAFAEETPEDLDDGRGGTPLAWGACACLAATWTTTTTVATAARRRRQEAFERSEPSGGRCNSVDHRLQGAGPG
eukprot:CAMPEP_0195151786 /NCGR_PEP_ID=MMETSP0448-20130528/181194_1 /TAXON_ID=66468 /ORGANISM="Heterocapsa triquestra, Strain CCMP 448" /LENGTH=467 /DNA_ID=CAMNT_0040190505 /DNA_START=24 /DNA_END=1425 /DNA_ORIENTATION=-